MDRSSVMGLDLAKNVYQLCGIDDQGMVVQCRRLPRWPTNGEDSLEPGEPTGKLPGSTIQRLSAGLY